MTHVKKLTQRRRACEDIDVGCNHIKLNILIKTQN